VNQPSFRAAPDFICPPLHFHKPAVFIQSAAPRRFAAAGFCLKKSFLQDRQQMFQFLEAWFA